MWKFRSQNSSIYLLDFYRWYHSSIDIQFHNHISTMENVHELFLFDFLSFLFAKIYTPLIKLKISLQYDYTCVYFVIIFLVFLHIWIVKVHPLFEWYFSCSKTLYWTKNEFAHLRRKFETLVQVNILWIFGF